MDPEPKLCTNRAVVVVGDGEHALSGDQGIAIAGNEGTAYAGREDVAIVRGNGDAEIVQFGVAACLHTGGTARGGHGVAAFVRQNGHAGVGDGGTALVLRGGTASGYHHSVAVSITNGKAIVGGRGSVAVLMQQGSSGSVMLGNDADEQSLLIIRYEDPDTGKLKFKIGVSGRACDVVDVQDGLSENVPYRLNDDFEFVPA